MNLVIMSLVIITTQKRKLYNCCVYSVGMRQKKTRLNDIAKDILADHAHKSRGIDVGIAMEEMLKGIKFSSSPGTVWTTATYDMDTVVVYGRGLRASLMYFGGKLFKQPFYEEKNIERGKILNDGKRYRYALYKM